MDMIFKASNGLEVRDAGWRLEWRSVRYPDWRAVGASTDGGEPGFAEDSAIGEALAEFFQNKHDEELGRWRWPENPDYVVYPQHPEGGGRPDSFRVFQESTGYTWSYDTEHLGDIEGAPWDAARAYFEAHSGPKPWHDAKPGEVWRLTTYRSAYEVFIYYDPSTREVAGVTTKGAYLDPTSSNFIAGVRIYPEGGKE